jgi:hypothetical protein
LAEQVDEQIPEVMDNESIPENDTSINADKSGEHPAI